MNNLTGIIAFALKSASDERPLSSGSAKTDESKAERQATGIRAAKREHQAKRIQTKDRQNQATLGNRRSGYCGWLSPIRDWLFR